MSSHAFLYSCVLEGQTDCSKVSYFDQIAIALFCMIPARF
jgi:hypothetical protein